MRSMKDTYAVLKRKLLSEYGENPVITVFLSATVFMFVLCVLLGLVSTGWTFDWMLFGDSNDTFMDFFNSVMYSSDRPYTYWEIIYPPLITVFYGIIGYYTIPHVVHHPGQTLAFDLRESQVSMMVFIIICLALLYFLHRFVGHVTEESLGRHKAELLFLVLLFSFPVLFALERGNSIMIALVCLMVFVELYRSDNRAIRIIAYIALGCAAGIKIFPAIFALLILRKRQYKEFLICFVIVTVLLLAPFLLTDGNIFLLLSAITSDLDSAAYSNGILNFNDLVNYLHLPPVLGTALGLAFTAICALTVVLKKEMPEWKAVAMISCTLVLCFSLGVQYLLVYMIIPLLYFLKEEKSLKANFIYIIHFIVIFALLPAFVSNGVKYIGTFKALAVLIMFVVLTIETYRCKEKPKEADDGPL